MKMLKNWLLAGLLCVGSAVFSAEKPASVIKVKLDGNVALELVLVKAGEFEMSAADGDNYNREVPHHAKLRKNFYIGRTEVTQKQWMAVMYKKSPSLNKGDNLPVSSVTWHEAMAFCNNLNKTGKAPKGWMFTLPTETQWEYAARGGNRSRGYKFSGGNDPAAVGWYSTNANGKPKPVGKKKANELGLFDMSGNVYEWCLDDYKKDNSKAVPEFSRRNDKSSAPRVIKGGGVSNNSRDCRSSNRYGFEPGTRREYVGFRVVLVKAE